MQLDAVARVLQARKEPAYRLAQVKRAFFVDFAESWDQVTTFSKALREACAAEVAWNTLTPVKTQEATKGDTVKTLFACEDGKKIEAVLMRHEDERNTVCVSSQVGCPMACSFCATGTMGLTRNLSAQEIVEQVIYFARWLKAKGERVTNVVLMGMGEPFHNFENVMKALRTLNDPDGFNLGARHMSVSTCGIVPGILKFADEDMQVNLAISLHSAIQDERSSIMPVNKAYPLSKLMDAVRTYMRKTNRRVMFEYLLLKGINDREEDAQALAALFDGDVRLVHVNVIKYHETEAFQGTGKEQRLWFVERLRQLGVPATHRVTFGEDIDAACGQLAVQEDGENIKQGREAVRASKGA